MVWMIVGDKYGIESLATLEDGGNDVMRIRAGERRIDQHSVLLALHEHDARVEALRPRLNDLDFEWCGSRWQGARKRSDGGDGPYCEQACATVHVESPLSSHDVTI